MNILKERMEDHLLIFERMMKDEVMIENTIKVAREISNSLLQGGRLLLCGNGGSASDAQHIAAEFVGRFQKDRKAYDAEALSTNTSTLTSVGNDYGFISVFSRQVEAKGRKGDVLIGITTSGKSADVIEALKMGRKLGMINVMLKGINENEETYALCDYIISIPSNVTARVQEGHIFIGHCLAEMVENEMTN